MRSSSVVSGLLVGACWVGSAVAAGPPASDLAALAKRFAPVLHQDTHSSEDYITRFDFDGNWAGDDNWKHQSKFPLEAFVYWSGVETATHVYLVYGFYHPRDVAPGLEVAAASVGRFLHVTHKDPQHENDLEGMMLAVEKTAAGPRPVVAETIFHRTFQKYQIDYRYTPDHASVGRQVRFEGEHPILQIQSHGHGVEAWDGDGFPGGDGVVYRVGDRAGIPRSGNDRDVPYLLTDIESTLWARRFDVGTRGNTFGESREVDGVVMGTSFLGKVGEDDGADAPWNWNDQDTDLPRGRIFMDPARLLAYHFHVPRGFARRYLVNPFLPKAPVAPVATPLAAAPPPLAVDPDGGLLGQ